MVIGELRAILWAKTCFVAAILNFFILGGNRWNDVVVPAIFEISIPNYPLGQSFMVLSGSAHQFHISAPLLHLNHNYLYDTNNNNKSYNSECSAVLAVALL